MKRLLMVLLVIALSLTACGSSEPEGEISELDVNDLVETRVASTIAATLGDDDTPAVPEPTIPAISGNVEPLTPIPQLAEDVSIEVSREVEYTEGRQDAPVTFDFGGGGATAEPQPTATSEPTPEAPPVPHAPAGGTVIIPGDPNDGYSPLAYTLQNIEFVDSVDDDTAGGGRRVASAREGYQLILLEILVQNVDSRPIPPNQLLYLPPYSMITIADRDDDGFECALLDHQNRNQTSGMYLPGNGETFRVYCQYPITVNADGLKGLRLVNSTNPYYAGFQTTNFEIDLGDDSGTPTDFSHLVDSMIDGMTTYSLPVSSNEGCIEDAEVPYVIESASWYDRPGAAPDVGIMDLVSARYSGLNIPYYSDNRIAGYRRAETPEEALALVIIYWNNIWSGYDFDALDLVAVKITRGNSSKGDVNTQLGSSFALIDKQPGLTPQIGRIEQGDRLVYPLQFLDGNLPPGAEHQNVLYALVPESDDKAVLLHQFSCPWPTANPEGWVVLDIPRAEFAASDDGAASIGMAGSAAGSNAISVSATTAHTLTAIEVDEGQLYSIAYMNGQWRPGLTADWPPVGPEGDARIPGKSSFPMPDAPLMALIFGIEGDNQVFLFEGPEMTFTAPASGTLWFGPNDDNLSDNAGELVIAVTQE